MPRSAGRRLGDALRPSLTVLVDLVFPPRCVVCDERSVPLCAECSGRLDPAPEDGAPAGLDALVSLCSYDGVGKDLVLALKRRNRRDAVGLLGQALAAGVADHGELLGGTSPWNAGPPAITWAPTSAQRRRSRGFDQSELIARSLGRACGLPVRSLLQRAGGGPQHGRPRSERLLGPRFTVRRAAPSRVVLVDDVVTSGATMTAAAEALRDAGADAVLGVTLARSPAGAVVRPTAP